jgi:tRNA-splicing ligase RtcB
MYIIEGAIHPIKAWADYVEIEEEAKKQLINTANLSIVSPYVAVMPDCHWGNGATVGSVVPTVSAIIPAAVGVDIGCGMMAIKTSLKAEDLPTSLVQLRDSIERAIPVGRTNDGKIGDRGAWGDIPEFVDYRWADLVDEYNIILDKYPKLNRNAEPRKHLGTLGTGNHFIEVCLDEVGSVWVILHSGSRGIGNKIGSMFIQIARDDMKQAGYILPDTNLSYLKEETQYFDDYVQAVHWAQNYALINREIMMKRVLHVIRKTKGIPSFTMDMNVINCHHNYVNKETHFGQEVWLTRKGAVSAKLGEYGIIPGSMGTRSYIVKGLGNPNSFTSCSHGAGRRFSRKHARETISVEEHIKATEGVECRKDSSVIDESPAAYKAIEDVMKSQSDLVEIDSILKQILCVKG